MKKSEMVKIIKDEVGTEVTCTDIERILEVAEDNGMLPPRTMLSHLKVEDNCWDPESESTE